MPLLTVSLYGYRGFAQRAKLQLAVPDERLGSGLTILVGPNNGGKSTVLEVLQFLQREDLPPSMTDGRRNAAAGGAVTIEYESDKGVAVLGTEGRGGDVLWRKNELAMRRGSVFSVPSRRSFDSSFGRVQSDRVSYIASMSPTTNRQTRANLFSARLFNVQHDRAAFDAILKQVLGSVPEWYLEQNDQGSHYLKFCSASSPHNSEGLGDGLITLFYVADALYDSKPGDVILLDEPELSLHPALQRRLAAVLAEFGRTRQIVIATHSPYFADWRFIAQGAHLARVHLVGNRSAISGLGREAREAAVKLLTDRNNPHVLGLDARETFFLEDGIVLVEGQDDVMGYPLVAEQLRITIPGVFYGWGVGGAHKMATIAKVLCDLGFKRVVGLLDQGQETVLAELKSEFPDYAFCVIPAQDIRTKKAQPKRAATLGLLDERGTLHQEHRRVMAELLEEIARFLSEGHIEPAPLGHLSRDTGTQRRRDAYDSRGS